MPAKMVPLDLARLENWKQSGPRGGESWPGVQRWKFIVNKVTWRGKPSVRSSELPGAIFRATLVQSTCQVGWLHKCVRSLTPPDPGDRLLLEVTLLTESHCTFTRADSNIKQLQHSLFFETMASDELAAKLARRNNIIDKAEDGQEVDLPSLKVFNPYTEFKEFSRKEIQNYQKMFNQ